MQNLSSAGRGAKCALNFTAGRLLCCLLLLVGVAGTGRAETTAPPGDLRSVLSALIGESDHNFAAYKGELASSDPNASYFNAKPIAGMVPGSHYVAFIKGSYYYIGDWTAPASIKAGRDAFFAMPGFPDGKGTYTVEADKAMSNAEKDVSDLLLDGRKVATYAKYHGDKEDTLSIGPFVNNSAERNNQAAAGVPAGDFRAVLSLLIGESDHNFEAYKGDKLSDDQNAAYFSAKPIAGIVPGAHYVAFIKGAYYYIGDLTAAPSLKAGREAFFAMPQFQDGKGSYTVEADKTASNEKKTVANLLLNGRKVAVYAKYQGDKEDTITIGPFAARTEAANQTAAVDAKTKAFTAGTQILVRAAAGNFSGMVGKLFQKTGDGDPLYLATPVPEMQTPGDDGQVLLQMENRYFYMNSYDDEASVAFAFASFLALPKNIPQDQSYAVEIIGSIKRPVPRTTCATTARSWRISSSGKRNPRHTSRSATGMAFPRVW